MPYKDPQKNARLKRERYANDPEYRAMILAKNEKRKQKNADEFRSKQNERARDRYKRNRDDAIALLGGKCVGCGTTHNLEFDHIDRTQKKTNVTTLLKSSRDDLHEEIKKCRLLCRDCHIAKSRAHYDHEELLKGCTLSSIKTTDKQIIITYNID